MLLTVGRDVGASDDGGKVGHHVDAGQKFILAGV